MKRRPCFREFSSVIDIDLMYSFPPPFFSPFFFSFFFLVLVRVLFFFPFLSLARVLNRSVLQNTEKHIPSHVLETSGDRELC